jgi:hypothetical protein
VSDVGRILDTLTGARAAQVTAALASPAMLPYISPWSDEGSLSKVIWSDVFGDDVPIPTTRAQAMAIPAVARARNLLVTTISRCPLVAYRGDELQPPKLQPTFLYATDGYVSPLHRLAWTVDDLIFYGWSLWSRDENSTETGRPLRMNRVNQSDWAFDGDGHIEIDGQVQRPDQVMLIPGLHEGVLNFGSSTVSDAAKLYATVRQALDSPVPLVELHQTNEADLSDTDIDKLIDRWAAARQGVKGGVGYTNSALEVKVHGNNDSQLLIEARNAASLDLARMMGVSANRIDATAPKSTLNYETTSGRNRELVDFDLALYISPIQARLSMDDIVPVGTRVAMDLSDLTTMTPSASGPITQD